MKSFTHDLKDGAFPQALQPAGQRPVLIGQRPESADHRMFWHHSWLGIYILQTLLIYQNMLIFVVTLGMFTLGSGLLTLIEWWGSKRTLRRRF